MKKKVSEKKATKKSSAAPKVTKEAKAKVAKKAPAAKKKAAPKKKAAAPKKKAASPEKKAAAPKKKATAKKRVPKAYTEDEIRIAAFYVYEERSAAGSPGDPVGDWNEAIRRLTARDKK